MLNTSFQATASTWANLLPVQPLAVRPATAFDAAAIARIYNESLPPGVSSPPDATTRIGGRRLAGSRMQLLTPDIMGGWITAHAQYGRPLWMAHADGQAVGWLSLFGFSERPACTCAAEVSIYITRGWQRRGVGRMLIEHALREAPLWDIDRLMAFIWNDNMPSRMLFAQCGFGPWGVLPGVVWAEGVGRDMLILGRPLQAAR